MIFLLIINKILFLLQYKKIRIGGYDLKKLFWVCFFHDLFLQGAHLSGQR